MKRRNFLRGTALATCGTAFGATAIAREKSTLVGIQIAATSMLDEGIEACLDFIQETAGINTLFLYSQSYHMGTRPANVLADDHPTPPRNPAGRKLPYLWTRLPEAPFRGLKVQHEKHDPSREYADRDIFAELQEPCRKRGIKIYARTLEAGMRRAERIPGYRSVATVDINGQPGDGPCWNHPEYIEWVRLTMQETMKAYRLDGLQYGAERVGPLSDLLFRGHIPSCFCEHCKARNEKAGIDSQRAKRGYTELYRLIQRVEGGGKKPTDGVMTAVLRILMKYPEILGWYQQWFQADDDIQKMVYDTAKTVRPEADVGQHVDHQRSSWDIFYRAAVSYERMAAHNDFIKPIVYHDILGPRLREWVIERMQKRVLNDLSEGQALDLFYSLFGHDASAEPKFAKLPEQGLSPEYVYREIRRCVDGAARKAKVYAGIGIDVPHYIPNGMKKFPSDPDTTFQATRRALEAGAEGVIASREYNEMTLPNLRAFGKAVAEG